MDHRPGTFIARRRVCLCVAKVGIIGMGPTGLVTGVALAVHQHQVFGFDADPKRNRDTALGEPPFYEPGLRQALRKVLRAGRFTIVQDIASLVRDSDILLLCVGTPSRPDGSMDDDALVAAAESISKVLPNQRLRTVVVKSTVLPGTTETVVRPILNESGRVFRLAMNPEFLQEGRALKDALTPDRIVVGVDRPATARILKALYRSARVPFLVTSIRAAEAIKYATNAFLATKVAFANELANLCEKLGVSYDEVHRGMILDPRINPRFLVPGVGFGGSCLPKDVRALVAAGRDHDVPTRLLQAVIDQNEDQPFLAVRLLEEELGHLEGKRIALLGLAFKGGTDDVRESRAIPIARALVKIGAQVVGFDPRAGANFQRQVPEVQLAESVDDALQGADGAILQADWPVFRRLTAKDFRRRMAKPVVVDGRRILNPRAMKDVKFRRIG